MIRRMRRFERRTIETDALAAVICDRCGATIAEFQPGDVGADILAPVADAISWGARFEASWGYSSRWDGERWAAELCEDCALVVRDIIDDAQGEGVRYL